MTRLVLALVAALALLAAPAADGAKRKAPAKRAKVVCFKKAGKKVCRKRRAATKERAHPEGTVPSGTARTPANAVGTLTSGTPNPEGTVPSGSPRPEGTVPSGTPDPEGTVPSGTVPAAPDCGTSPWVGYGAEDVDGVFKLTGKRTCVPGPTVIFQLRNLDAQDHNLYIEGVAPAAARRAVLPLVEPGQTGEATTTLAAGEWRLFCDIEGHETMSRTLTVKG